MRDRVILLYDKDQEYVERFVNYFEEYPNDLIRIVGFSEESFLWEYMKQTQEKADILLTNEEDLENIFTEYDRERIILFTEEEHVESIGGIDALYKYQPMENIVRYLLNRYTELMPDKNIRIKSRVGKETRIIGIYSPVKRCGKTALSMELAEQMAKNGKVLMLNLEEHSALRRTIEDDNAYDLADLLYFYMQNSWTFELKLKVVLQKMRGFDYIPPMRNGEELRNITIEQWRGMISEIARVSDYQIIVLDLSDVVSNIFQLLHMCDYVIMPFKSDEISCGKIQEFENGLSDEEREFFAEVYRLSMDGVIYETFDNERLKANVSALMGEGKFIADGE